MKKCIAILLSISLLFALCGCGPNEDQFVAHYISDGYRSGFDYPHKAVIHNTEELSDYYSTKGFSDPQLQESFDKYSGDFFSDRILIVLNISLSTPSGTVEVTKISESNGQMTITLQHTYDGGLAVMAAMHILIEMDASWDTDPENIQIKYV